MGTAYLTKKQKLILNRELKVGLEDIFEILEDVGIGGINQRELFDTLYWLERLGESEA